MNYRSVFSKVMAPLILGVACLSFSGCGDSESEDTAATEEPNVGPGGPAGGKVDPKQFSKVTKTGGASSSKSSAGK
ncbi:hypothetical protein ACYOEI_04540 [Singulisphaera rosea]